MNGFRSPEDGVGQHALDARRVLSELAVLSQDALRHSLELGPRGWNRGVQAATALFEISQEYIQRGELDPSPVVLRKLFEKLGATYIKLGQFIASSPSLFPDEYVLEFEKCLDQTDPVSFEDIKRIIDAELSIPATQVFSHIDRKPLASASVAQVHKARLRGSDKDVALKVLKPGVEDVLAADLTFLLLATRLLQIISPALERTSIVGIVEDIRESMLDEVDFTKEAANIRAFSGYLDRSGMRAVATCPFVYRQYSSRRLLTLELIDGAPLTDLAAIRTVTRADPESVLINALNAWAGSLVLCETFHADVHAGNALVMRDGRVAFIDFGIVGRVGTETWAAVEALARGAATSDYRTMAAALATMKATDVEVDVDALGIDLKLLFERFRELENDVKLSTTGGVLAADVTLDSAQVNRVLLEVVRVGETHGIRFPREFGLLLKQMLYFNRYIRILAPQLEVFNDSRVSLGNLPASRGSRGKDQSSRNGGQAGTARGELSSDPSPDIIDVNL